MTSKFGSAKAIVDHLDSFDDYEFDAVEVNDIDFSQTAPLEEFVVQKQRGTTKVAKAKKARPLAVSKWAELASSDEAKRFFERPPTDAGGQVRRLDVLV
jgi:hypothetical protein